MDIDRNESQASEQCSLPSTPSTANDKGRCGGKLHWDRGDHMGKARREEACPRMQRGLGSVDSMGLYLLGALPESAGPSRSRLLFRVSSDKASRTERGSFVGGTVAGRWERIVWGRRTQEVERKLVPVTRMGDRLVQITNKSGCVLSDGRPEGPGEKFHQRDVANDARRSGSTHGQTEQR